ncbi:hypothetical protein Dda_1672 [Drechslerella dactyloides]|uniref:Uncharacterized protein n=1 Tax=Drechslerella dactyloides TaxID=74499 RepID=A0AAD6J245_DREDA|nr:hypothetical protein Dda_1672 [Drechslerella dactyloides]
MDIWTGGMMTRHRSRRAEVETRHRQCIREPERALQRRAGWPVSWLLAGGCWPTYKSVRSTRRRPGVGSSRQPGWMRDFNQVTIIIAGPDRLPIAWMKSQHPIR